MWLWHVTCDVIQVLPSSVSTVLTGGCSRVTWVSQCKVTVWPVTTGSLTDNRSGGSEGSEGRSNDIVIDKLRISRERTWFAMVFVWHVVLVENVFHTLRGIENITLFNIRRSHYFLVIPSYMWGFQRGYRAVQADVWTSRISVLHINWCWKKKAKIQIITISLFVKFEIKTCDECDQKPHMKHETFLLV